MLPNSVLLKSSRRYIANRPCPEIRGQDHLDQGERHAAMEALAELTADGGEIFMSLRHGPIPEGRRMFDVSAEDTVRLAARYGLRCDCEVEREDMLGRSDVKWSFLALRKQAASK